MPMFFFRNGAGLPEVTRPQVLSLDENVLAVTSNSSIAHLKSDQLLLDAFFLLFCQRFAPDEFTFIQVW